VVDGEDHWGIAGNVVALRTAQAAKGGGPDMFYSVDRSGLYQTGGTLDLWK
jgi:hypothetical protein